MFQTVFCLCTFSQIVSVYPYFDKVRAEIALPIE
jgi:hypothetical protein